VSSGFYGVNRSADGWGRYYFHIETALLEIRSWLVDNEQIDAEAPVEWIPYTLAADGSPILQEPITKVAEIVKIMGISKVISNELWKTLENIYG